MKRTIKETADLVISVARLVSIHADVMEDGKVKFLEYKKLLKAREPLETAIVGIDEVPAELIDMDSAEFDELASLVRAECGDWIEDDFLRSILGQVANMLSAAVELKELFRNRPKVA